MALVHTAHLPFLADYPIYLALFKDVENASFLRQQLLEGNPEFEYAFLDATMMLSSTHVFAAVSRAINDMVSGRLKSRNVHSEIVFSFNPNNNIADSFRHFGIQPSTKTLLAIKLGLPDSASPISADSIASHLTTHVQGTLVPFTDEALAESADIPRIKKVYKLNADVTASGPGKKGKKGKYARAVGEEDPRKEATVNGASNGANDQEEVDEREMEACVLGIMALKGS